MEKYTLGLYEQALPKNLTIKEKLQIAKEANYDSLELCIDATEEMMDRINMSKEERLDIVKAMYETGVFIDTLSVSTLSTYALGDLDDEKSNLGLKVIKGAILLAKDLGVRIIMIPGYDLSLGVRSEKTEEKFLKNLEEVLSLATRCGIILGFETMGGTDFMDTATKAKKYVDIVNSPYLAIYPDIGNLTNMLAKYDMNIIDDLTNAKGKIVAVHLKETLPGVFKNIPYGEGHVEFEKVIKLLLGFGVRKFTAETWLIEGNNWKADILYSANYFRKIFDKIEII